MTQRGSRRWAATTPSRSCSSATRATSGERVALREKEFGIWQSFTWREYHDHVRDFSLGLVALGLEPGDKVAIIGDNRPEWVWSEIAAQAAGAASVGLYQDSNLTEVAYVIDHCDASSSSPRTRSRSTRSSTCSTSSRRSATSSTRTRAACGSTSTRRSSPFEAVEEKGRALAKEQPTLFEENVRRTSPEDVAIICYTSGTTGNPKGAMLTFRNLLSMSLALDEVDPKRPDDEFVSFLPLAWIGEQMMSLSASLARGFTVNFPEEPDTVTENIREIGPDVMFAPPRVWESMVSTVQVKIMDTTPFKRFMYERCMPVGKKVADLRFEKKPVPFGLRVAWFFADWLLFRALKDRLGMTNLRSASTGGAALGPDVFRFFHALGVPLRQIYGQTEIAGISCIHRETDIAFHTVGVPIPGTERPHRGERRDPLPQRVGVLRLLQERRGDRGDRSRRAGSTPATRATSPTTGHLVVIDRLKDVMKLADGTQFSPQFIENRLKFSPYVKEAVVVGKDRPFLTAMLCIDMGVVGKWAEKNKLSYTTYTDLSAKKEVYDLVQQAVDEVNETLPEAARIEKFVLLYKELDADDEELTRTRKVRRVFVEERYKEVISALYGDAHEVPIDTTIRFQDGKTSRIRTTLLVRRLEHGKAA